MRAKLLYAIAVVVSLALVAAGIYRQVDARSAEPEATTPTTTADRPRALELAPTPLTVSLSRVGSLSTAAVGATSFVTVNAAGPEISAVRVYDGDDLVGVQNFDPPAVGRASVQVEWPAVRAGAHVLHAEAVGTAPTEVGHSAPVRLRAVPGVVEPETVRLPGNGRTPREIAAATGVDLDAISYAGLKGSPLKTQPADRLLPPGIVASVPFALVPAKAPATPAAIPDRFPPTVSLDGCRASVATDDEATVYELTGGSVGFVERGTATSTASYTTGDLTPGPHVFVVGAVDGPAGSAPVSVDVPDDCLGSAWDGDASLLDGELSLPESAAQVWVYLGVDGAPFTRYPAVGTVSGAFGIADLAGELPPLRGRELRMEVWRAGDTPSAPAVRIARSTLNVDDPDELSELVGVAPGVALVGAGGKQVEMSATDTQVDFTWSTESFVPDGVVWQVLGRPLPAGDHNTAPPVLLATGFSPNGDGVGVQISGQGGTFTLPAALLLGGRPASEVGDSVLHAVPTPTIQELVSPGSSFGTTPLDATITKDIQTLPAGLVPVPIGDVYVRVLPVAGEAVVGDASNTVPVTLPPLSDSKAGFVGKSVAFDPGHAANPDLSNCVRITGTPTTKDFASIYASDGTWCASDFDGPKGGGCSGWCRIAKDLGSLVEFVADVWDYIAQAYNTVVQTIVTVIAKFNPYCLTASATAAISKSKYADSAAEGCEAVATVVASVAVTVVLSSFGLPARLPTSDQIVDVAEGNLTGLAVAYLEQLGVPCNAMKVSPQAVAAVDATGVDVPPEAQGPDGGVDLCAAMINQAVGQIREQVKQAAIAETANVSGLPVPPAPQTFELEPRGQYHGAEVRVVADPIDPKTPRTARCVVYAKPLLRTWDVGGLEGKRVRYLGYGARDVAYNPLSALGFGPPWRATIRLRPIDTLYDTDEIAVTLSSPCFKPGSLPQIKKTPLLPPLGRWKPGEAD